MYCIYRGLISYVLHYFEWYMYMYFKFDIIYRVCYERVSWQPTLLSFTLSALWHGFYPGYYCCFVGHALTLVAAKKVRVGVYMYMHVVYTMYMLYLHCTCLSSVSNY